MADSSGNATFASDPAAATRTLRRVAANNVGITGISLGTAEEYAALSPDDQISLTDEMSRLIVQYPAGWPTNVVQDAQIRMSSPYYGQPLQDATLFGNLVSQVADGTFESNMMSGGANYLSTIGVIAAAVLGLMLLNMFMTKNSN